MYVVTDESSFNRVVRTEGLVEEPGKIAEQRESSGRRAPRVEDMETEQNVFACQ